MKNKGENKIKSNESDEFIHYIVDPMEPLYVFRFSFSKEYISDPKTLYK